MTVKFSKIVEALEKIEATTSRIQKTRAAAEIVLLDERIPYILNGKIWPAWEGKETGVSTNTLLKVLTALSKVDPQKIYIKTGDIGAAAQKSIENLKQKNFFTKPITIDSLYGALEKLALTAGENSQKKKEKILTGLFMDAKPTEAKYIARLLLSEMRTGVADAIIRDAIAKATNTSPEKVERAYMLTTDWREVVKLARENHLDEVHVTPLRPIAPMLAHVTPTINYAINEHASNIVEWKYDGARVQVHKKGKTVKIYSRRLEEVTNSLPEIVNAVKTLPANEIIFEGEAIAINKDGKILPFQYVLRRFRRKNNMDEVMKNIKIEVHAFDLLYLDGEEYIDAPLEKRREQLEKILPHGILKLSHALRTNRPEEAEKFYRAALDAGHEGVMIKDATSPYEAGKRGRKWLKFKPVMEPLDLVITAAEWGDGKRAGLLAAFEVSVIDEETGELLPVGKVGTGFTDEDLKEFTEALKPLIREQLGKTVVLEPKVIITVAYQEIQRSPKYRSGYSLRFPRYVATRTDKSEPDTLQRLIELYRIQKKKRKRFS